MSAGFRSGFWKDRPVLVTGHTGFKGAWLCAWLAAMGARVRGLALAPEPGPNLWRDLALPGIDSRIADLSDRAALAAALEGREVVFHLAAQSLVRRSYRDPVGTFATNVTGTVALLAEAALVPGLKAVVVATSDKAYANDESGRAFTEGDPMGGHDPYSASKGATELAAASMRASFFRPAAPQGHPAGVATVRAGNVIGGGDWSEDRLVPDIVRGCLGPSGQVTLRAPQAVRPWQHVLEPLRGYLMLAERLAENPADFAEGWNFGPGPRAEETVGELAGRLVAGLGQGRVIRAPDADAPHEAHLLRLDASKASRRLGWDPVLDFSGTVALTAEWYRAAAAGTPPFEITRQQIAGYAARLGSPAPAPSA